MKKICFVKNLILYVLWCSLTIKCSNVLHKTVTLFCQQKKVTPFFSSFTYVTRVKIHREGDLKRIRILKPMMNGIKFKIVSMLD